MYNDITPRRGAVRSTARPATARPVPTLPRHVSHQQPYGASSGAPVVVSPPPPIRPIQGVVPPSLSQAVVEELPRRSSLPVTPLVTPVPVIAEDAPAKKPRKWYRFFSKRSLLVVVPIVLVLGATTYVAGDAWLAAHQAQPSLTPVAAAAPKANQTAEGTDTAPLPASALASYMVAADLPRALTIEKLTIAARVLPMGINKDNSMQAPVNINDSGWYTGSAKPGTPGAMVIDGHSSATNSAVHRGLFNAIDTLSNGDIVSVEKGDGTKLSYRVVAKETVALAAIDMHKVMLPYGSATEGLNLITCSGQWTDKNSTLDHRTIVYTERIAT